MAGLAEGASTLRCIGRDLLRLKARHGGWPAEGLVFYREGAIEGKKPGKEVLELKIMLTHAKAEAVLEFLARLDTTAVKGVIDRAAAAQEPK